MTTFANRAELRTGIFAHLGFVGGEIADSIGNQWIGLCEADINRRLRLSPREETVDITLDAGKDCIVPPAGFRQIRDLYLDGTPRRRVLVRDISQVRAMQAVVASGKPRYVAVKGNTTSNRVLVFGPAADVAYTGLLTYWKEVELTSDTDTNEILTEHPDIYLYGSLMHAEGYMGNDPRIPVWEDQFLEAVTGAGLANTADQQSDRGAAA